MSTVEQVRADLIALPESDRLRLLSEFVPTVDSEEEELSRTLESRLEGPFIEFADADEHKEYMDSLMDRLRAKHA